MHLKKDEIHKWVDFLYPPMAKFPVKRKMELANFYLKYYDDYQFNEIGQLVRLTPPKNLEHKIINSIFSENPGETFEIIANAKREELKDIFYFIFDYLDLATLFLRQILPDELFIRSGFVFSPIIKEYIETVDYDKTLFHGDIVKEIYQYKRNILLRNMLEYSASAFVRRIYVSVYNLPPDSSIPQVKKIGGFGTYFSVLEYLVCKKSKNIDPWETVR
ncbi:MAG: hypothetical protein QXQ37_05305 [Nitrososphaerota archaeon]